MRICGFGGLICGDGLVGVGVCLEEVFGNGEAGRGNKQCCLRKQKFYGVMRQCLPRNKTCQVRGHWKLRNCRTLQVYRLKGCAGGA